MPEDDQRFTLVFNGDIRNVKGNVFKIETPFGVARAASVGDALAVKDELLAALKTLADHVDGIEAQNQDYHQLGEGSPCRSAPLNEALAAIAKASS